MIERRIYDTLVKTVSVKPVTLITGARQVGKTTLCRMLMEESGMEYVTLADSEERQLARQDPSMFMKIHPYPLIIDEVQYAPGLFQEIESVIDRERFRDPDAHGLFVLSGSQSYRLMEGVSESMSGRVGIIRVPAISLSEEYSLDESPFRISPEDFFRRGAEVDDGVDMMGRIHRGMYPEVVAKDIPVSRFYADYVETYIMRDVSEMINVRDKDKFWSFMEVMASLTGQELVYESITKAVGIDNRTLRSWISVLVAGDIITLLEPYSDTSVTKRVSKRPKIHFRDTGLACYLAKIPDAKILSASYLKGPMTETFIVNEVMKTHVNKGLDTPFFHYRDTNGNEVDLVMLYDGKLNMIECKAGADIGRNDITAFGKLGTTLEKAGCGICLADKPYPITKEVYAIPLRTMGA